MKTNFTEQTKATLYEMMEHKCSNPDCNKLTYFMYDKNHKESVLIGQAVYIATPTKGGIRYDKSLTPEQKVDINNGIWLCEDCARTVDSNENYTAELLRAWKWAGGCTQSLPIGNITPYSNMNLNNRDRKITALREVKLALDNLHNILKNIYDYGLKNFSSESADSGVNIKFQFSHLFTNESDSNILAYNNDNFNNYNYYRYYYSILFNTRYSYSLDIGTDISNHITDYLDKINFPINLGDDLVDYWNSFFEMLSVDLESLKGNKRQIDELIQRMYDDTIKTMV